MKPTTDTTVRGCVVPSPKKLEREWIPVPKLSKWHETDEEAVMKATMLQDMSRDELITIVLAQRQQLRFCKKGFHDSDCKFWEWDWNYSWHESDCNCSSKSGN